MFDNGEKKKRKAPPDSKAVKERTEKGVDDHIKKVFKNKEEELEAIKDDILKLAESYEANKKQCEQNLDLLRKKGNSLESEILLKKNVIADLQKEVAYLEKKIADKKSECQIKGDDLNKKEEDLKTTADLLDSKSDSLTRLQRSLEDEKRTLNTEKEDLVAQQEEIEDKKHTADNLLKDAEESARETREKISDEEEAMAKGMTELGKQVTECREKTKRAEVVLELQELVEKKSAQLDEGLKDLENERIRNRTLFKNIEEDTNQNAIMRRNLNSREADLNRREKEIKALESTLVAKET